MTRGRNAPTGWAAFRALRQTPAPIPPRRHGNWKHGHFAKGDPMAKLRFLWALGVLNGRWNGPPPWAESAPPGWSAFRRRRAPGA
jgi:hypothetical protein